MFISFFYHSLPFRERLRVGFTTSTWLHRHQSFLRQRSLR